MASKYVIPILYETYLVVIKNSVGSRLFRNFYANVRGKKTDIMQHGALSCAFFVSSILAMFKLIGEFHGTVDGTAKDLKQSGWKLITKPRTGCILVWGKIVSDKKNSHKHIGFYIGNRKAISNNSKLGQPVIHHWTFGAKNGKPKRKIEAIYWHKKLNQRK
ncbi:hypothetical protein IIA95_01685 [Patescibacteria group bacterium]|nr:hypothetical protein [Patescibacteria group bacterium]